MLAPRRMFLCEVQLFLQKNFSSNSDCPPEMLLMGRVTHISCQPTENTTSISNTCQQNLSDQTANKNAVTIFAIEDGTASLDVVAVEKHPPIKLGQLVDCIGRIYFIDNIDELGRQHEIQKPHYLEATSLSILNNPQEETLRQLELSSMTATSKFDNHFSQNYSVTTTDDIPKNRVLVAGDLQIKLNTLYHTSRPYPSVTLNTNDAYRYISYSANYGGISLRDLESLVGAIIHREKMAVREAVEDLQKCGMVYMKDGRYYPL
eukprot:CCRYP_020710-RA/>CCRYP_020710-RA protein AED:0.22 eAED:0.22 QI:0/-1/0/1/-1/1/1/0/261